jgi:hypothetical protein
VHSPCDTDPEAVWRYCSRLNAMVTGSHWRDPSPRDPLPPVTLRSPGVLEPRGLPDRELRARLRGLGRERPLRADADLAARPPRDPDPPSNRR